MPGLARFIIKLSLLYLAVALLAGVALSAPIQQRLPVLGAMQAGYIHLFVVGWLTQLIFGVAYWLFPRRSREKPFGCRKLAVSGFAVLNAGLLLRIVAEPAQAWDPGGWAEAGTVASAVLMWLGCVLLAAYFWTRVRTR